MFKKNFSLMCAMIACGMLTVSCEQMEKKEEKAQDAAPTMETPAATPAPTDVQAPMKNAH